MSLAIPLAYAFFSSMPALAAYNLVQEYSGSKFFDGWDWQDHVYDDTTHGTPRGMYRSRTILILSTPGYVGHVFYLSEANAMAKPNPIAYLNDAGNAVIKIDNTTSVDYENKRNSVSPSLPVPRLSSLTSASLALSGRSGSQRTTTSPSAPSSSLTPCTCLTGAPSGPGSGRKARTGRRAARSISWSRSTLRPRTR